MHVRDVVQVLGCDCLPGDISDVWLVRDQQLPLIIRCDEYGVWSSDHWSEECHVTFTIVVHPRDV